VNVSFSELHLNLIVETTHGHLLERVLDYANDRLFRDYYALLADEVRSAGVPLVKYGVYGDVTLTVEVGSPDKIDEATAKVDRAVANWKRRYRIDNMKDRS
jgi:hypothetical protein